MMAWYRAGLISVAQGAGYVDGVGTQWLGNVSAGDRLVAPDGRTYLVSGVQSNARLSISPPYAGPSIEGQPYLVQSISTLPPGASDLTSMPATGGQPSGGGGGGGGGGDGGGSLDVDALPAAQFPVRGSDLALVSQSGTERKIALSDLLLGAGSAVGVVDLMRYKPTPGSDITQQWLEACAEARSLGHIVRLPPYPVQVSQTGVVRGIVGTPGLSELILAPDFTKTGFANEFCILNPSFGQEYNEATADDVLFAGFKIRSAPNAVRSFLGLGNVRSGLIHRVHMTADRVMVGGYPVVVSALIDLYAAVKDTTINGCQLRQLTGGYAAAKGKIAEDGGGCIWVRNLSSAGAVDANATEDIEISGNKIYHTTSDEAVAIFGVRGTVRRAHLIGNHIHGLPSVDGVYHSALVTIFPLGVNSDAAVYDCSLRDNVIIDRSFMYNVIRIGNASDASRVCKRNKSSGNVVLAYRDPATQAAWVAAGSPGGVSPEIASNAIKCVEGIIGQAYDGDVSGNTSTNDTVMATLGGAIINTAFEGWQSLNNPTTSGTIYTGVGSVRNVTGGSVECFGRAFYNCNNVVGTKWRVNGQGPGFYVFEVDSDQGGHWALKNTLGYSAGAFVRLGPNTLASSRISVLGNDATVQQGVAISHVAAGVTLRAHHNNLDGAFTAIESGGGTVVRSQNTWGSVSD